MSQDSKVEEMPAAQLDQLGLDDSRVDAPAARRPFAPLSVGVIVDLFQSASAGGHVKTWERLAGAACGEPVDLTVYFFGSEQAVVPLADNVRYVHLPPVWSTGSLSFLSNMPAHTDLAPLHPRAFWRFRRHQVLHATDAYFSLARTARMLTRWSPRALVHSTQTDTPGYARVYTDQVLGHSWLGRTLRERWQLPDVARRRMKRRLDRYLRRCDWVLAPDISRVEELQSTGHSGGVSLLRRGIDSEVFHPRHRDRARLERDLGIPSDHAVLLYVGRVDGGKDVLTLARAARILVDRGLPVHVVCAGEGSQMREVRELLGERVSLPGQVPEDQLAWLYASADLFVFCSQIEVFPNVVLEAKASGLPVVVSANGGSARLVRHSQACRDADGVVVSGNVPEDWAGEIERLLRAPECRRTIGENARRNIESTWPTWQQVLREDLLPVWQSVARPPSKRADGALA